MTDDDWVSPWTWRDFDFDLRVRNRKLLERVPEKRAEHISNRIDQVVEVQTYFIPLELPAQSQ
jgi:hypothetical protein